MTSSPDATQPPIVSQPQATSPVPKPAPTEPDPGDQLHTMANVMTRTLKDTQGTEWKLYGLSFRDYTEYERRLIQEGLEASPSDRNLYMVWLSVRKHEKTREDLRAGRYAISYEEFAERLDLSIIDALPELTEDIMRFSGFKFPDKEKKEDSGDKPAESL